MEVLYLGMMLRIQLNFFCTAENYFLQPDSLEKDSHVSDLRNTANGADYIIITHEKFLSIAEQLYNLRTKDFPDTSIQNPRIKVDASSRYL